SSIEILIYATLGAKGSGEWGMGNGEWGWENTPCPHSPLSTFPSPSCLFCFHSTINMFLPYMKLSLTPFLALCLALQVSAQNRVTQHPPGQNPAGQNPARKTNEPVRWRPRIDSRAEFDSLSRISYQGRFYALPHLMFVIDRAAKVGAGNRVYYVNSK